MKVFVFSLWSRYKNSVFFVAENKNTLKFPLLLLTQRRGRLVYPPSQQRGSICFSAPGGPGGRCRFLQRFLSKKTTEGLVRLRTHPSSSPPPRGRSPLIGCCWAPGTVRQRRGGWRGDSRRRSGDSVLQDPGNKHGLNKFLKLKSHFSCN